MKVVIPLVVLWCVISQSISEPPVSNFQNSVQTGGQTQNYGTPPQQQSPQSYGPPRQQPSSNKTPTGPTVTCSNGMLMSTAAGMAIIGPCMEKYKNNMKCVEYCYAENAMQALSDQGDICFERYIDFIQPNFPSQVVGQVTNLWNWCWREFGQRIDKNDKSCMALDQFSMCIFGAFQFPC